MASWREARVTFDGPEGPLAGILCEPTQQRQQQQQQQQQSPGCHHQQQRQHQHQQEQQQPSGAAATPPTLEAQQQQPAGGDGGAPAAAVPLPPRFSPRHCAMLCHGFGSHKDGFHLPAIAHHLAQQLGMSSLRFDYAGNMDSPGPFRFAGLLEEVQQMGSAKRWLEQQHGKHVVLLLGHSRGAINATLYSGHQWPEQPDHHQQQQQQQPVSSAGAGTSTNTATTTTSGSGSMRVPLVVLVAGRFDLRLNMYQRYSQNVLQELRDSGPWQQVCKRDGDRQPIHWSLTAEDMAARFAYDIPGACAAISSTQPPEARPRVLVVHGGSDPICQASDAAALAHAIAGAELFVVEGADHWFRGRQQQLLDAVSQFVAAGAQRAGLLVQP